MNITINEPCHENWDAMAPNQQGAFCKSCMKNVVDFSKMTLEEIKIFFNKPQAGKVCGRFEEKQLTALSFDDFFARFRYWNFAKKFTVIFFFTFGFWIFSNQAFGQNDRHLKGEVAFIPDKNPKKNAPVTKNPEDNSKRIMGKIKCVKPEVQKTEEPMIMGDVAAPVTGNDTIVKKPVVIDSIQTICDTTEAEPMVVGLIAIAPENNRDIYPEEILISDPAAENNPAQEDLLATGIAQHGLADEIITIYPNPASNYITIQSKKDEKQTAYLYDESGKLVLMQEFTGDVQIDVSNVTKGAYNLAVHRLAAEAIIRKKILIVR